MNIGKETGLGPALRVLRHYRERRRYYQMTFPNGERAVVLVAGMPAPSVELVRLVLGGVIPWQTVWEYTPTRAGGYSNYIYDLKAMFAVTAEGSDDSLHWIRDALLPCQSIEEARALLLQRERMANGSRDEPGDGFTMWRMRTDTGSNGTSNKREPGSPALQNGSAERADKPSSIPARYRIREGAQGRILSCVEAPTITVRVDRGIVISAKQARKYPAGTIFLDGAAKSEPFVDFEKDIYNLDHHQGCIRSLASCEQAVLLIRKRGDLRKRDWLVLANDGDLDTIFAAWVLLNYLRLNESPDLRVRVMPMLRLEGVIDAHGPDAGDLSALPPELLQATSAILKQLRQQEAVFKSFGRWPEIDLLEYFADRLRAIDEFVYAPEMFERADRVDELARAEITNACVAVVCSSEDDMEEVEQQCRRVYGERLGILVFQTAPSAYVVRRIDRTLPATLEEAYDRLNLLDPAVKGGSQNRWSGSAEIGASPRKTGTALTPDEIIAALRDVFRKPAFRDSVPGILRAMLLTVGAIAPALALIVFANLVGEASSMAEQAGVLSAVVLTITAMTLYGWKARSISGAYGWRRPHGLGWLVTLPAAFAGAVAGGVWHPGSVMYPTGFHSLYMFGPFAALLFPLSAELIFRGVILGRLALRLPIRTGRGSWWGSWPTVISSALYAAASLLLFMSLSNDSIELTQGVLTIAGALVFGIASGVARERSESIVPSVLLHCLCAAALLVTGKFLF